MARGPKKQTAPAPAPVSAPSPAPVSTPAPVEAPEPAVRKTASPLGDFIAKKLRALNKRRVRHVVYR